MDGPHQLDGRAVRVGDEIGLRPSFQQMWIDLGHDQRHVGSAPEGGTVVDDEYALGGDTLGVGEAGVHARTEHSDVDRGEIGFGQRRDRSDRQVQAEFGA